jgi:hypothetical protein
MRVSQKYLDTFETKQELRDAIFLRLTVIRNAVNMPEEVKKELTEEINQFKEVLKLKYKEDFD